MLEVVQALDGKVGQEADEAGGIWADGVTGAAEASSAKRPSPTSSEREAEDAAARMYFI